MLRSRGKRSATAILCALLSLAQALPAAALAPTLGHKVVDVPSSLDMIFIPTDSPDLVSGTVAVVFPDVKNATFYEVLYRHVVSGQDGYFPHAAHPGQPDKFTLSSSFGNGEAIAPVGSHWVGLAGAFFANSADGYDWLDDNFANPRVQALVPDSVLNLSVTVPGADDTNFDVGAEIEVRVTIEADATNNGTMTNVNWTPLTIEPADMVEIVSGPTPASIPQNFSLFPGGRYIRSYVLRALRPGAVTLSTNATGKSAAGITIAPGPSELDLHLLLDFLEVEVEVDKPLVELVDTPDGPIPQDVIATVTVTNVYDEPIENVVLDSLDPGSLIAPPPVIGALTVKAGPLDPAGPNPDPSALGTIDPGGSVVRTYTLEAKDDGHYEVVAFVTGDDPLGSSGFVEIGKTEVKISGDVVLYFESHTTTVIKQHGSDWVLGGNSWRVVGTIENRSSEDTILVLVQPNVSGNAFYAQPIPDGTAAPDVTCAMGIARQLAPQEKVNFTAPVRTLVDGGTRGTVKFEPKGFRINEDGSRTALADDEVYYKGGSTEHIVRVDVSTEPPVDASTGELVGHLLVGTVEGLGRFAEGIVGLVAMAGHAIKFGLQPWEWPEAYRAAGDKVAKYLLDIHEGLSPADKAAYDNSVVAAVALALGSSLEDARGLVDTAVEEGFTKLNTSYYTGDSRAVAEWFGEIAGENPDLVIQALVAGYGICKLAHRGALSVRRGLIGFSESQAATLEARAAQGARALKAGDILEYDAHLARIFGVDKLSHRLLQDLAAKWNIMIAVRRRGAGVIAKLKTGRFTLKPFPIKAKNVSPIDVDWLGFPNRLDEVVIKQPPPWAEVEAKMTTSAQSPERIAEVKERWQGRWKEWYGKGADPVTGAGGDLSKSERGVWAKYEEKGIPKARNSVAGVADNVEAGFSLPMDDAVTELRPFRGDLIAGADGRPAIVANIEDPIKGWQGVTGDIDPMAFLRPDGTILPQDVRLKLYRAMRHLGFQHPESITWNNAAGRNAYLEEFSVHNPTSETMACYRPDGTVTATRFDPGKSWIDPVKPTVAAQMYFHAATTNVRSAVPTPVEMEDMESLVEASQTVYVAPNTWAIINPNCPGNLQAGNAELASCPLNVQYSNDPDALVLRQSSLGAVERWTPAGGWRPYVPTGTDIFLLPQTALAADADAGTTVLQVQDLEALGMDPNVNEWFEAGQVIVINPGGDNEELATVAALGSLILAAPLQHDHVEGETVSVIGALSPSTTLPVTTTTMPLGEPPAKPTILSLTPDAGRPLAEFALEMSPFDDPDEGGGPSGLQVLIGGPLDDASKGTIYQADILVESPQSLQLPAALLDVDTDYTIVARYVDSSGLASEFSEPYAFTTTLVDPADADGDGIEDRAELTGEFDLNGNAVNDSTERISVFADAEMGEPLGIFVSNGQVRRIRTLSELEALGAARSTLAPGQLPVGMVGVRIGGLPIGQQVAMTYYLEPQTLGVEQLIELDPNAGFVDLTGQTAFFNKWLTVQSVDGGVGDLDGVANGRIVDTSGAGSNFTGGTACATPLSGSSVGPSASDCLFILRTAVGLGTCSPACSCAPKGTLPISASDALVCLKAAIGTPGVTLRCPCD